MSPRKSSTSSADPSPRPRYLALEVAGDPFPSPRWLENALAERLRLAAGPARFRVIRWEGARAIVEVPHTALAAARGAWNGTIPGASGGTVGLRTARTFGTLVKGRRWLGSSPRGRRPNRPAAR